jgi:hypothetical protein
MNIQEMYDIEYKAAQSKYAVKQWWYHLPFVSYFIERTIWRRK